jgi:hypothetical protein
MKWCSRQLLPKHPAQCISIFTAGTFEGFCDFFAGFQARLCFTEDLALTTGFSWPVVPAVASTQRKEH